MLVFSQEGLHVNKGDLDHHCSQKPVLLFFFYITLLTKICFTHVTLLKSFLFDLIFWIVIIGLKSVLTEAIDNIYILMYE